MNNLFDELAFIESEIDDLTEIVEGIRAQMTARISKKEPITKQQVMFLLACPN